MLLAPNISSNPIPTNAPDYCQKNHTEMSLLSRKGRGILVAFEGCDRGGKSTQCKMLVDYFKTTGRDVAHFSFPGLSRWITQRFVGLFFDFFESKIDELVAINL